MTTPTTRREPGHPTGIEAEECVDEREAARAATIAAIEAASKRISRQVELRVTEGPQAGARLTWEEGATLIVATDAGGGIGDAEGGDPGDEEEGDPGDEADVLLFEPAERSCCVRLHLGQHQATVTVLRGEVRLDERRVAAGGQAIWSMYSWLRIGSSAIAFGQGLLATWPPGRGASAGDDVEGPAEQGKPGETAEPVDFAASVGRPGPAAPGGGRRAAGWLIGAGAGVAVLCAAAFTLLAPGAGPVAPVEAAPVSLRQALDASPFAGLAVSRDEQGRQRISGRLISRDDRRALERWLAGRSIDAEIDVDIDEVLAGNVAEIMRLNGVTADVAVTAPGTVHARAAAPDEAVLARAAEAARRDVPGLRVLTVENTAPAPAPDPVPALPDDPDKRIVSVVPGSPGYLITADGAHYFEGAMLPSGHRVVVVGQASVTLERSGRRVTVEL